MTSRPVSRAISHASSVAVQAMRRFEEDVNDSSFSPSDIAGLQLWLDASDANTITEDANGVSQWDDKSGNGYDVSQSDNSLKPSYVSGQYVEFDGTGINLNRTQALGLTSITIFGVFETIATAAFNNNLVAQGANGNNWMLRAGDSGGGNLGGFKTVISNSSNNVRTTALSTATTYILSAFYDETSGNKRIYLDGDVTQSTTLSGALDTDETLLIIGSKDTTTVTKIRLREILVYDNSVSQSDADAIGAYLSDRWSGNFDGTFDGTFA